MFKEIEIGDNKLIKEMVNKNNKITFNVFFGLYLIKLLIVFKKQMLDKALAIIDE